MNRFIETTRNIARMLEPKLALTNAMTNARSSTGTEARSGRDVSTQSRRWIRAFMSSRVRAAICACSFAAILIGNASAQEARYVWSGVTIEGGKTTGTRIDPQDRKAWEAQHAGGHAERYRQELANIQLAIEVSRDFDEALKKLDDLHVRAAWSLDYDGRMNVLAEIAAARAELLAKLGKSEDALRATNALLLDESEKQSAKNYELIPADGKAIEAEIEARKSKPLVALREKITNPSIGSTDAASMDAIEKAVVEALANHQPQVVLDIGPRAAPSLEKLVLSKPEPMPPYIDNDPLRLLLMLSKMRGAQLMLDNYDKGTFLWHKRILRAMSNQNVLETPSAWEPTANQHTPPRLLEPIWVAILSRLLEDPLIGREAMDLVASVAKRDALSSDLQVALSRALASNDVDLRKQAVQVLAEAAGRQTVKPVLESALDAPDANVRRFAAEHLLDYPSSDVFAAHADSPDLEVRLQLARSLRQHMGSFANYTGWQAVANSNGSVPPVIGEKQRSTLARLCKDAEGSVRLEAARSSITLRPPLEPSIYAALARDPDPRIRSVIATRRDSELPTTTFLPAYNQLAADSDPSVLNEFDASFAWMCESDAFKDDSQDVVELLKRRHANRSIEIQGRYADVIYGRALGTSAGVSTIMNWALDGQDDKLLERAVRSMPAPQDEATRVAVNASVWRPEVIDDATLERIYVRIYTLSRVAFDSFQDKLCVLSQAGRARVAAMLPVIGDTKRARQLRLAAARVAAPAGGEPVLAALRALFTDICWSQSDPTPEEFRTLQMIGGVLPAQDQEQLALQLATTSAVPDAVAVNLLVGMDKNRKYPSQAVRPILDRWFARVVKPRPAAEVAKQVVRRALLAIPNEHDDALSKYLIAAIGDPQLGWDATHQMGQLRWPEFLDPLGQLLMHNPSESGGAIESITGYMNDDAAKYLLQAAGSTSDNDIRKACFAGLESIRKYQDETARWNLRKSGQRARDEAVQQLLPMLDDSDATVRAQAARSLATLDAVEYLPRLVKMLKDPAPEVREAAKKALETLNASGAKKP